ncbi:MAG: hypothetical protein IJW21_00540 [Clostridia bacterium]|nr:hypothetical protein [Clostridia bacterium]
MLLISATGISPTELFIIEGLIGAFSLLPAFGYLNARFNYYIISEKNIVHSRMFHKNKVIEYSDILYIQYYFKGDSLTVYNKHGIPLISIDRVFAGIERLTDILEEKGIRRESAELVTEEMVHSEEYMRGQKKARTAQIIIIAVCIISVAAVIIGGYLYDAMH